MTMKTQMVINRISLVLLGAVILNHVDKVDSSSNCVEQNVSCQHGACIDGQCHCDTGYQGVNCTEKSDSSSTCVEQNVSCQHGTCIDGQCHCDTGYQGVNCTEKSEKSVGNRLLGYAGLIRGIFFILVITSLCWWCCRNDRIRITKTRVQLGYTYTGTGNTFYNPSFHYENSLSSETNSLSESIPETVADHRMPIIFGTSPDDHRQQTPTYNHHQNHSAPSIDTLGNSQELTNNSTRLPTTNEANCVEDQPSACSELVIFHVQVHQPFETAACGQLREGNPGDVDEHGLPSYEEAI